MDDPLLAGHSERTKAVPPPASGPETTLRVKTAVPRPVAGIVQRPRLFALLESASRAPVTCLTAPAGSGKTQLVASWVQHLDRRVAWLTLDMADREPSRYWSGVLNALRRAVNPPDSTLLATLVPAPAGGYSPGVAPALIVDALSELAHPVLLILDDVNVLDGSESAEGLSFLMTHLPASVRLLLLGTHLPDLPTSRLKLEGKLTAIPPGTLAFDEPEAEALFRAAGVHLAPPNLRGLIKRTEGWSAGLRFAALTYNEIGSPTSTTKLMAATQAEVDGFLAAEVLRHLPKDVRSFLLHTCICDRICGELGDFLTGGSDGSAVLRWLAEKNIFTLSAVDESGEWYRYHHMFAAMLRERQRGQAIPSITELHQKASKWYAKEDLPLEAFDHAIRGGDPEQVWETFSAHWLSLYLDGYFVTLREQIDELARRIESPQPELDHIRRVVSSTMGSASMGDTPTGAGEDSLSGLVLSMLVGRSNGDLERVSSTAMKLLAQAEDPGLSSEDALDIQALTLHGLGVTEYWADQREPAEAHLRDALTAARRRGREYVELGCISQLVGVLTAQNRLNDAAFTAAEGVSLVRRRGWEQAAAAAELWHALGWISYLRDELDAADKYLDRGDEAVGRTDTPVRATIGLVRALVLSQRGFKRRALTIMEAVAQEIAGLKAPHVFGHYVFGEIARLHLALGHAQMAKEALSHLDGIDRSFHFAIAQAEVLIADSLPIEARCIMETACHRGEGFLDQRIQATVLLATLRSQEAGQGPALATMLEAVQLAEPERMIQPLLQFGPRVDRLLETLHRRHPPHSEFITEVRGRIAASVTAARRVVPTGVGIQETLTPRELEVLMRLDSLDTLPEIAADLFVSVNTVKAHLRNLYRKLGAHGRREALARAEQSGLL